MSKRTDSIVAVTIARYATIYVEADTPQEAVQIVRENLDEIYDAMPTEIDEQFEDSEQEISHYDSYTTESADYMYRIWADGKAMTSDEYFDALEEQEDEE